MAIRTVLMQGRSMGGCLRSPKVTARDAAAELRACVVALSNASTVIEHQCSRMSIRKSEAISRACAELDRIHEALAGAKARAASSLEASRKANLVLMLKTCDDLHAISQLVDALASMCEDSVSRASSTLASLSHVDFLTTDMRMRQSEVLGVPVSMLTLTCIDGVCTLHRDLPDGAISTANGLGTVSFVEGSHGLTHNRVTVTLRGRGAPFDYIKQDDVTLMLANQAGATIVATVHVDRIGVDVWQVVFTVEGNAATLSLSVFVCGSLVCSAAHVPLAYNAITGQELAACYSIPVGTSGSQYTSFGVAVTPDDSIMVVPLAFANSGELVNFSCTA
jgi:hypothetical protein